MGGQQVVVPVVGRICMRPHIAQAAHLCSLLAGGRPLWRGPPPHDSHPCSLLVQGGDGAISCMFACSSRLACNAMQGVGQGHPQPCVRHHVTHMSQLPPQATVDTAVAMFAGLPRYLHRCTAGGRVPAMCRTAGMIWVIPTICLHVYP
jgi:hypothetical protein